MSVSKCQIVPAKDTGNNDDQLLEDLEEGMDREKRNVGLRVSDIPRKRCTASGHQVITQHLC